MFLTLSFTGFDIAPGTPGPSNCVETSSHYDPFDLNSSSNAPHGLPGEVRDRRRHVGALGNIESEGGIGNYSYCSRVIELNGADSIIGKGFTVHAGPDLGQAIKEPANPGDDPIDCAKEFGCAGPRVACGTIDVLN